MSEQASQTRWVLPFREVGGKDVPSVGGKGAQLGELAAAGLSVPPGFCVTTAAFERFLPGPARHGELLAELDELDAGDVEGVRRVGERVRQELSRVPVPEAVESAVVEAWRQLGEEHTYAVRSSATLEDMPDASFAGTGHVPEREGRAGSAETRAAERGTGEGGADKQKRR